MGIEAMKTVIAYILIASTALADCRYVAPLKVQAYRQTYYAPTYVKAAIIAVEDPYHVEILAPELRAKQRAKEQASDIADLKEVSRQNTEALRLLTQAMLANKGTDPGVLQQQAPADDKFWTVLRTNCAKCHTGDGSKGSQKFFETDGRKVPLAPLQIYLIESVTNDNSMPPGDAKLSTDDYQVIRKHYEDHRAEIRAALKGKSNPIPPVPGELK